MDSMTNLTAAAIGFVVSFAAGAVLNAFVFRKQPDLARRSLQAGLFSSAITAIYIYCVR